MSDPREQTTEVLREHRKIISGPMRDSSCSCKGWGQGQGWEGRDSGDWAEHAADAVVEALGLTEERERTSCTHPTCPWTYGCGHDGIRFRLVSGWSVVGGEPTTCAACDYADNGWCPCECHDGDA